MIKLSTATLAVACLFGAAGASAAQDTTAADKKAAETKAGTQAGAQAGAQAGQTAPAPAAARGDSGGGQDKPAARKKEQDLTRAIWREQALQLLPSVTSEAEKIENVRERLHIIARAAAVLWAQDQERAQADFVRVAEAIDAFRPYDLKPEQLKPVREKLWGDLLQEAVRVDRTLAARLQQVKARKDPDFEPPDARGDEKRIEQQHRNRLVQANTLAQMAEEALGQKKTDQALDLARQSLNTGVASPHLANIFIPLKMSAGAQVDGLFETYLNLLLQRPDLPPVQINLLAVYTFPDMQAGFVKNAGAPSPSLSPRAIQKFLDVALLCLNTSAAAVEAARGGRLTQSHVILFSQTYAVATRLQPKFAAYAPPRKAEALNALAEQLGVQMSSAQRRSTDAMVQPPRDWSQMLETAGRENDPNVRDTYYGQAALMAVAAGDSRSAQEILEKISNSTMRQRIEQQLLTVLIDTNITQGNFAEALAAAQRLKPQEQYGPLVTIARAMVTKGDRPGGMEILEKLRRATEQADNDLEKVQRLTDLARVYLTLAPESVFDLLKPITNSANEVLGPNGDRIVMSVREPENYVRVPNPQFLIPLIFNLDDIFETLAKQDFFRAHDAARSLVRPELRLHTQLAVLRSALEPDKAQPPKPEGKPAGTSAPPAQPKANSN